ncbi:hypothetical protein GCM10022288_28490 [Gryllotalpicola kribbensis]|uniref:Uncharacterized protein n=1 Tax=Gryllotalpicola kribbensis TaxID=993084 RepID=A0ABP8AZM0_9MICO
MHFRGHLGSDAPDPALEIIEQVKRMPVPVLGLVPQRHLEDWDAFGIASSGHDGELYSCAVSISYTLWRNPHNIDDPRNLAELDDALRVELGEDVPWDRPAWLLERVRRMRYPLLWEAVTTHWNAEPSAHDAAPAQLAAHVNHILMNGFRATRVRGAGGDGGPGELDSPVDERHAEHGVTLLVNGYERSGIRIDTDPDVYGVGVALDDASCVTAVVPRDELRFIDLAFATRRF